MSFSGTDKYIASGELQLAVNAAIVLQKPLPIKGSRVVFGCNVYLITLNMQYGLIHSLVNIGIIMHLSALSKN